jgi:hypothetical protein
MKNRILRTALITLILFMGPVFTHAQGITTVTATIVDPNGIPWAGATVQATLLPNGVTPRLPPPCNGQNASPCFVGAYLTGGVSSLGTFSMNLPDNGVLLPGGTTWQFTVSTNGAPAPLGTGPQLFTVTTAINCATNTPATCTAGAMNISATLGPVPALGFGSAGSAVSLTPSTNQTITPVNTTSVPLTIVGAASTSVDLFDVETNGLSKAIGVNNTGTTISLGAGAAGGTINCFLGGGICTINSTSTIILTSSVAGSINLKTPLSVGLGVGVASTGLHLTLNAANEDTAGKLTCAASTVTKTFATAFTSTPTVIVFDETTKGGANLTAISNTAFTVSCTGATDALDYIVVGNPN